MKNTNLVLMAMLLVSSISFASTEPTAKKAEAKENTTSEKSVAKSEENLEEEDLCTISCSVTQNGVTYTATSGNWLTSCNKAGNDCLVKLGNMTLSPH